MTEQLLSNIPKHYIPVFNHGMNDIDNLNLILGKNNNYKQVFLDVVIAL
jgi:hypothetical protein